MLTFRRQDGFTLVELMMATAITLIVLATATGTFKNALLLNDTATLDCRLEPESAVGHQRVRARPHAGRPRHSDRRHSDPVGRRCDRARASRAAVADPAVALTFDNITQTTLSAITTGYQLGPLVNGRRTDIVTMLALDPTSYVAYPALAFKQMPSELSRAPLPPPGSRRPVPALAADGASLDVGQFSTWISDPVSGIKAGDILLFNNQNGTAIQTVTSVSGTTVSFAAGDPFNFNQRGVDPGFDHADPRRRRRRFLRPTWSASRC